jgi:hypothetical protein
MGFEECVQIVWVSEGIDMTNIQTPWKEIKVNNITALNSLIIMMRNRAHLSEYDITMIFRGQAKAEEKWTLKPTLLRSLLEPDKLKIEEVIDLEFKSLENFKKRAHLFHKTSLIRDEDTILDWWSLMQHYGAPTRMLDWTMSPYVALYYAVSEEFDTDGAIWFLNVQELTDMVEQLYGEKCKPSKEDYEKILREPNAQPIMQVYSRDILTDRMINQQGLFTVCHNVLEDHAYSLGNVLSKYEDKCKWLCKVVIPKEHKIQFLSNLHAMNITGASLFPGADGIGRYLNELMHIESGHNIPEIKALQKEEKQEKE